MSHGMQLQGDEADDEDEFEEEGFSLEELSQTYAKLQLTAGQVAAEDCAQPLGADGDLGDDASPLFATEDDPENEADAHCPVTPLSIVEAVLWVGRPDSRPITAEEIAGLMRGVDAAEVGELIAEINRVYAGTGRAFRIAEVGIGYRLQLADDLNFMADRFYGRVREVRLNQAAIDCLALVL
jgi:segregation and condensation protein B